MKVGMLVVLEGINGCGKTTILKELCDKMKSYYSISVYKFPNRETKIGKRIDAYLKKEININSKYDVLDMFAKNRLEVRQSILNDLSCGKLVICDRYIYSAIAYHIPITTTDIHVIKSYSHIISRFDKTMPSPHLVVLIKGDYLQYRQEDEQRFHYSGDKANAMFNILHKLAIVNPYKYIIVENKFNSIKSCVNIIVHKINEHRIIKSLKN